MRSTSLSIPIGLTSLAVIATAFILRLDDVNAFAPVGSRRNFLPVCHNVGLQSTTTTTTIAEQNAVGEKDSKLVEKNGKAANNRSRKRNKKTTPKGATSKLAQPSAKKTKGIPTGAKTSAKKSSSAGKGAAKVEKASKKRARQFKPLKHLKLGSTISGTVVDVCEFGAFISTEYATRGSHYGAALLHISQISDERVANIHDVMVKGQKIENARVINVDIAKGEIGLSMRAQRRKRKDISNVGVGDELVGRVAKIVEYGAFIDVGATSNPLLHISRITGSAIENIRHHLNEGDPVSVHVIDVNDDKKTVAVSMLDKKADQYLDRRLSQRMKKLYGSTKKSSPVLNEVDADSKTELDHFDSAIRDLEDALGGTD